MKKVCMRKILRHCHNLCLLITLLMIMGCASEDRPIQEEIIESEVPEEVVKETHIITDNELSRLYTCREEPINDTCLVISVEDAQLLMKIAVLEDHTDALSQAYIMSLVLNRLNSPDFPDTITEVLEQEGQFLKLTDKRFIDAEPDINSHLALAMVESGVVKTDFLYYEALWVKDSWASTHREVETEYGGSRFYK